MFRFFHLLFYVDYTWMMRHHLLWIVLDKSSIFEYHFNFYLPFYSTAAERVAEQWSLRFHLFRDNSFSFSRSPGPKGRQFSCTYIQRQQKEAILRLNHVLWAVSDRFKQSLDTDLDRLSNRTPEDKRRKAVIQSAWHIAGTPRSTYAVSQEGKKSQGWMLMWTCGLVCSGWFCIASSLHGN